MTQILCLERHAYAPELNTLHLRGGGRVRVPGVRTISEARRQAFPKPHPRIWATIVRVSVDGTVIKPLAAGSVLDRREALIFRDLYREKFPQDRIEVRTRIRD